MEAQVRKELGLTREAAEPEAAAEKEKPTAARRQA